jgi:hypothetical protein
MKALMLYACVVVFGAWVVAHAVALPAEHAFAAIFAPVVEALK